MLQLGSQSDFEMRPSRDEMRPPPDFEMREEHGFRSDMRDDHPPQFSNNPMPPVLSSFRLQNYAQIHTNQLLNEYLV